MTQVQVGLIGPRIVSENTRVKAKTNKEALEKVGDKVFVIGKDGVLQEGGVIIALNAKVTVGQDKEINTSWRGKCCKSCYNALSKRCRCRCGGRFHGAGKGGDKGRLVHDSCKITTGTLGMAVEVGGNIYGLTTKSAIAGLLKEG